MASLPNDPPSYDYYRVIFRKTYSGVQKSKTFYFRRDEFNKSEVRDWKKKRELAFKEGSWSPWGQPAHQHKGETTVGEAVEQYLKHARQLYAESTYDIRKRYLHLFRDFVGAGRLLQALAAELSNDWINQSKLTFPTRKNRLKTLNVFFKWTRKRYGYGPQGLEVIASNREKQKYYNKQHKGFITESQLAKVLRAVRGSERSIHDRKLLRDFYRLAFYTTRRRSDLLAIKREWVSDSEPLLRLGEQGGYLPKSQIIEYVPLLDNAWGILKRYEGHIFSEFTPDFVTKQFQDALEEALPRMAGRVSLHNLRDSGIMHLIWEEELDLKHVRQMTGHRSLRSLEIYTHPWAEKTLKQLK